jgi:phosphoadenosine phosphosulfate reductase
LDTGYHFQETLIFKERLRKTWGLNVIDLHNEEFDRAEILSDKTLCGIDMDRCCYLNKVVPMEKALQGKQAWLTGIRRDQTAERSTANILECKFGGLIKINPLLNWTQRELWQYINDYDLPLHPLYSQGYPSVSCTPCSSPVQQDEHGRSGRWEGTAKTECGLHTILFQEKYSA